MENAPISTPRNATPYVAPQSAQKESNLPENAGAVIKDSVDIGKNEPTIAGKEYFKEGRPDKFMDLEEPMITKLQTTPDGSKPKDAVMLTIIHTNDIHGNLTADRGKGGIAQVAGQINNIKQDNPDYILVDGGDIAYSPPISDKYHFDPMVDYVNQMNYDAVGVGNHEFQWESSKYPLLPDRIDNVHELTQNLKMPLLGANIIDKKTGAPPEGMKAYVMKEVNGVKIGIIGVCTPKLATEAHPDCGEGIKVLDSADTLKKLIPQVKKEGADLIVVISHENLNANKSIIGRTPDIDVMIGAHDHASVDNPMVVKNASGNDTFLVEAGSYGMLVGSLRLRLDPDTKKILTATHALFPVLGEYKDPKVQDIVDRWKAKHNDDTR